MTREKKVKAVAMAKQSILPLARCMQPEAQHFRKN
jgi:hypothetical protein